MQIPAAETATTTTTTTTASTQAELDPQRRAGLTTTTTTTHQQPRGPVATATRRRAIESVGNCNSSSSSMQCRRNAANMLSTATKTTATATTKPTTTTLATITTGATIINAKTTTRRRRRRRTARATNTRRPLLPLPLLLLMTIAATTLPFATVAAAATTRGSSTLSTTTGSASASPSIGTGSTTIAPAAAHVADGQVIGATALAAAAAAAAGVEDASLASGDNNNGDGGLSSESDTNHDDDEVTLGAQSANLLLEDLQHPAHMVNLTRHHDGDVFRTNGVTSCDADTCVGLSSGTAGLLRLGGDSKNGMSNRFSAIGSLAGSGPLGHHQGSRRNRLPAIGGPRPGPGPGSSCDCRCLPYLSTYREDLGICVDDIHECTLSPFVSGSSSEKIPFVFLPLRGQIIYPSREISFPEIRTPVCAVTGAQYLTTNGWTDLRNPIDTDYPFRMFRDEGRTFLQWLGEPDLRQKMQGRLIVVHLVCRDMMLTLNATAAAAAASFTPPKNVFSPCVAFRVNGSPVKYFHNVSEVLFQAEATSTLASTSDGMTTKEYVVIGVCSLLLGLIYVSSVFLYLHMKKRKGRNESHMRSSLDDLANEINYPKNDQVTFGAPFNRSGSLYSAASLATSNEPRSRASIGSSVGGGGGVPHHLKEDGGMGIVKNNPLLQHFPQLGEHLSGFASDISNSNSECEMDGGGGGGGGVGGLGGFHDKLKQMQQMQTSALVHPSANGGGGGGVGSSMGANGQGAGGDGHGHESPEERSSSQGEAQGETECLPVENVSIVEDMMTEEKLESMRAMINGTVRKKLYFNPAYFEPHLLAQPPPAAVEFLTKIREVIAIAKYKMATKRYQPSLIMIPEEAPLGSTTASLYSSQLQMSANDGCRGCATNRCSGHVKNCGDKRNSIEKWLQSVPLNEADKRGEGGAAGGQADASESTSRQPSGAEQPKQSEAGAAQGREKTPPKEAKKGERRHSPPSNNNNTNNNTSRASPPRREITSPKQRPPPPPTPKATSSPSPSRSRSPPRPHVIAIRQGASYEKTTSASTTITVTRNYDAMAALSTAAHMYGFAELGGEIYNNPKFILHDSPAASQRSRSSSHRSKASRKRLEALDQYAAASTPTSLTSADREHYEMLRNMKQLPPPSDAIYDAIKRDLNANGTTATALTTAGNRNSFPLDIPTPDYDSTIEKKIKDIYNNTTQSSAPSVPTPDYSTLSKKSLRQCQQPDSPIYRRKSPQYLIVDYETDSLERLAASKRKSSSQTSSSPSSSDVSSQLSPSLSTALPLEEELEISHTVYDQVNGFRKEGDHKRKLHNKAASHGTDVSNGLDDEDEDGDGEDEGGRAARQKEIEARIKYDTPFRGSMTIEVEHEPPSDMELSTDSDQYEPDTLDRKPKKHSFCDINPWSEHLQKSQHFVNAAADGQDGCEGDGVGGGGGGGGGSNGELVTYQSLENMNALAARNQRHPQQQQQHFVLRSSSSARSSAADDSSSAYGGSRRGGSDGEGRERGPSAEATEVRPSFESLREIYQSKLTRQNSQTSQTSSQGSSRGSSRGATVASMASMASPSMEVYNDKGRLLTLEERHTRRQRIMERQVPPPEVETVVVAANKTTIKIRTPNLSRAATKSETETEPEPAQNRASCSSPTNSNCTPTPTTTLTSSSTLTSTSTSASTSSRSTKAGKSSSSRGFYDLMKTASGAGWSSGGGGGSQQQTPVSSLTSSSAGHSTAKKRAPPSPPPPPPPTSASTTLTSQRSNGSSCQQQQIRPQPTTTHHQHQHHLYQNQTQFRHHSPTGTEGEETASNHSESTEITGVSDTQANSEFDGSRNNTLSSDVVRSDALEPEPKPHLKDTIDEEQSGSESESESESELELELKSRRNSVVMAGDALKALEEKKLSSSTLSLSPSLSPSAAKKKLLQLQEEHEHDYGAMIQGGGGGGGGGPYNGLRNDYSLNKYLNRRKSIEAVDDETTSTCSQIEAFNNNNNISHNNNSGKSILEADPNKLDVISISSRSNRSSSRLSDRTKEMYRNAGVPVGIAYPQRSNANNNSNSNTNTNNSSSNSNINSSSSTSMAMSMTTPTPTSGASNVQTVYRCEIEPVQLTHGMQIAMGLKDRAKKAKDLKNAWKKFVSMAAAKFSPTASPAPPYEKKTAASFLEALERDEGISSLIDDHPQVSTPKSTYSAPPSSSQQSSGQGQNYYEQRFGTARLQELDSGYMSADSSEAYKRSFYDRYNFRMMSGRDRVIRVDTIEDNSDAGSTLTESQRQHNGCGSGSARGSGSGSASGDRASGRRSSSSSSHLVDSNRRFENFEHLGEGLGHGHGVGLGLELDQDLEMGGGPLADGPAGDSSDADSDKTLTRSNGERICRRPAVALNGTMNLYSSEEDDEERGNRSSYGSSETDGETNVEDMWESGAESVETHSVLYKNVRKN